MSPEERKKLMHRIECLSIPEPMTGCWLWIGQTHASRYDEYGRIEVRGRRWRAHRAAVVAAGFRLSARQVVRHLCNTPLCVNPQHLKPGTQRQNVLDQKRSLWRNND